MSHVRWGCPFCGWSRGSLGRPDWDEEMIAGHLRQSHPIRRLPLVLRAWLRRRS